VDRDTTIKQLKSGGPSGARSRDLRIKRPDCHFTLGLGNSSAEITRVFFREPRLNQHPLPTGKTRGPTLVFWKAEPAAWGAS
jgi:hypothetical protein